MITHPLYLACFGKSGENIHNQFLVMNPTTLRIAFVDNNIKTICRLLEQKKKITIVANVEVPELHTLLLKISKIKPEIQTQLFGYFLYPYADEETDLKANRILRLLCRLHPIFIKVRIINLPKLSKTEKEPEWPIAWNNCEFGIDEKQIIWEILLMQLGFKTLTEFKNCLSKNNLQYPLHDYEKLCLLINSV
jgi:hypothetical protein